MCFCVRDLHALTALVCPTEAAKLSFYSSFNTQLGLILEWWGFVSLFYNFTPRFVAQVLTFYFSSALMLDLCQVPRELKTTMRKLMAKMGFGSGNAANKVDNETRQVTSRCFESQLTSLVLIASSEGVGKVEPVGSGAASPHIGRWHHGVALKRKALSDGVQLSHG